MSPIHSHKGKPGLPGEPGEPGTGGGGTGGRGGTGGEGGSGYYYPRRSRKFDAASLFALFICVLAISLLIFIVQDRQRHNQIADAAYIDCLKTEKVAQNQRRVITALLTLEGDEQNAGKDHIRDIALLQVALDNVPTFDCRR